MNSSPYRYSNPYAMRDVWEPIVRPETKAAVEPPKPAAPVQREPLDKIGERLLTDLPGGLTLAFTAQRYPHIVNRLARLWLEPRAVLKYIEELLYDDRPNRVGFEFNALQEMTDVREFLLTVVKQMGANGSLRTMSMMVKSAPKRR